MWRRSMKTPGAVCGPLPQTWPHTSPDRSPCRPAGRLPARPHQRHQRVSSPQVPARLEPAQAGSPPLGGPWMGIQECPRKRNRPNGFLSRRSCIKFYTNPQPAYLASTLTASRSTHPTAAHPARCASTRAHRPAAPAPPTSPAALPQLAAPNAPALTPSPSPPTCLNAALHCPPDPRSTVAPDTPPDAAPPSSLSSLLAPLVLPLHSSHPPSVTQ